MNKKQIVKISENHLKQVVSESVKRILNENTEDFKTKYYEMENLLVYFGSIFDNCGFKEASDRLYDFRFNFMQDCTKYIRQYK